VTHSPKNRQRGGTLIGLVIGLVLGLAVALAVAVYVTKVPVPFMNKTQTRTPEQDAAESKKNQNWDPNAPLYGKNPAKPLVVASDAAATASEPASAPAAAVVPPPPPAFIPQGGASVPVAPATRASAPRANTDPLGDLAAARAGASAPDPFTYFVQAGAFRLPEEAEAQRAKLSLMGLESRVSEREQSGRAVYRVRVGPLDKKADAERIKARLDASGVEATLVRVQR
jgi:cell division protein FtsN